MEIWYQKLPFSHLKMKNGRSHRSCVMRKLVVELTFLHRCTYLHQDHHEKPQKLSRNKEYCYQSILLSSTIILHTFSDNCPELGMFSKFVYPSSLDFLYPSLVMVNLSQGIPCMSFPFRTSITDVSSDALLIYKQQNRLLSDRKKTILKLQPWDL